MVFTVVYSPAVNVKYRKDKQIEVIHTIPGYYYVLLRVNARVNMKRVIALVIVIGLVAAIVGYRMYNKPHRSVDDEESLYVLATTLFDEFEQNEQLATSKYLNKAVEVTGVVSEVSKNQEGMTVIVLKTSNDLFGISCTMENNQSVQVGTKATIKGFCMGYLSDVVIHNGKIVIK